LIKIYNTLTRQKEELHTVEPGKVKMYVCGPTVYNFIHLGNARPLVVFDTVRRYLEYKGYDVTFVQNFTDIDDKIIKKANELNESPKEISEQFIQAFHNDAMSMSVKKADIHPKVTENIDEIITFISELIQNGSAYNVEGDVYFRTDSFNSYGKLSNQSIEDLKFGARVEVEEKKENPLDFALWKAAKPNEIAWKSPWGEGRPGWHIECSAMVKKYLGETIDIHGGGADLIFPHHENEIAQSESCSHKPLAKYWMHNGYININNEKMSKSLGNVYTVKELLEKYEAKVLRFALLSVHYRHPINFSEDFLIQSGNSIERIETAYVNLKHRIEIQINDQEEAMEHEMKMILDKIEQQFEAEMDDDFNTANAMSAIFELAKQSNIYIQQKTINNKTLLYMADLFKKWIEILGLESILEESEEHEQWIDDLVEERNLARNNKQWQRADEIRDSLLKKGIVLEDTPQGVRWKRK